MTSGRVQWAVWCAGSLQASLGQQTTVADEEVQVQCEPATAAALWRLESPGMADGRDGEPTEERLRRQSLTSIRRIHGCGKGTKSQS